MSERYRRLPVSAWHHPQQRRLNDGARIVRFYVMAGTQTTSVGCFRMSSAVAVEDLGGTTEQFEERLSTVCEAFGWSHDALARVIWIRDWFEWNPPASPNVVASWAKLLRNVPACAVRDEAVASITASLSNLPKSFRDPWTDLAKSFRRSEVQPETYQGTGSREQRSESERAGARRALGSERDGVTSNNKPIDERLLSIAREGLQYTTNNAPLQDHVDAFYQVARAQNVNAPRAEVISAVAAALTERRSA